MKKVLFVFVFVLTGILSANAQSISKNALGLRLGDDDGFGGEINYQRAIGDNNRLEFGLGLRDNDNFEGFKLTGLYQWVWNIDGGFNWYAGAGGGLANYDYGMDSETFLFAAGNIGIEYNFDIPLLLSLDFRPEFGFGDFDDDFGLDIALGIRYQF